VFINITKERIAEVFDKLDLGIVDKIDFVRKQGPNGAYNAVYVHLKYWLSTDASRRFRDKLFNSGSKGASAGAGAKLVYEDPWFWVVLPNTSQERSVKERSVKERSVKEQSVLPKPKLIRNAKVYPEISAKNTKVTATKVSSLQPRTPPQSPPLTPPLTPKKVMPRPLDLEQMEANLFAAEALLASFGTTKRPRTNSEEDAMSLEEGEM
jgi:hypothetical protein